MIAMSPSLPERPEAPPMITMTRSLSERPGIRR